jgi:NnrU protein
MIRPLTMRNRFNHCRYSIKGLLKVKPSLKIRTGMNHDKAEFSSSSSTSSGVSGSERLSFQVMQYALGGWAFFIAENALLSENRAAIIAFLGSTNTDEMMNTEENESNYRILYGTFSTIATASILYGYRQLRLLHTAATNAIGNTSLGTTLQQQSIKPLLQVPHHVAPTITVMTTAAAISLMSLGLILVSQAFPKLQIPIEISLPQGESPTPPPTPTTTPEAAAPPMGTESTKSSWSFIKVRCPFDFTGSKPGASTDTGHEHVTGIDRVTRHSGLWSLGFLGLANSLFQPSLGLTLFMTGPIYVAWVGGYHYDTRLRRNMGGSFPFPQYEAQTSNVPFAAMILGQQKEGNFISSLSTLLTQELKVLNAVVAIMIATLYVTMNKGRHVSYLGRLLSSRPSISSNNVSSGTSTIINPTLSKVVAPKQNIQS